MVDVIVIGMIYSIIKTINDIDDEK